MIKKTILVFAGFCLAGSVVCAGERVLFAFDDVSIPWRSNLKLTLVEADKHPANPVLKHGLEGAPDYGHAIMYGSVLHVGGRFRMWYLGMTQTRMEKGQAPGYWRPMCYAESQDGVTWTKPDLGLVDFKGARKNNICLIESDPYSLSRVNDFLSVMYDPDDPDPARRYKCAYIAHLPFEDVRGGRNGIGPDEKRWCSFVCAVSADGLTWKVVGDRPANAGGERFEVSGLYRFGACYYAPGQILSPWASRPDGGKVGRVMRVYRSVDFDNWSQVPALGFARPGQLLAEPIKGQQTHMGAGLWNRGNVLVGLYGMWQDGPKPVPKGAKSHLLGTRIDLGLVVSNDGIRFREPVTDFKTIPLGREGEWDQFALLQAHAFANVGDRTYMWYSHWDCDGEFRNQDIGLATLRRDGFGYLSARSASAPAVCESAFFDLPAGAALHVNADGVTPETPLTVTVLNETMNSVATARVTRPGTRVHALLLPQGRSAVRISLPAGSAARLYAFYITESIPSVPQAGLRPQPNIQPNK